MTLATLGFYIRPWMHIDYPDVPPSVGRFEGDAFDPEQWKPEYPNPAFGNMRPDDAFWAARIVARFSDDAIRAIVEKAQLHGSARGRITSTADADQAARQGSEALADRRESAGGFRLERTGRTDVRQRRR